MFSERVVTHYLLRIWRRFHSLSELGPFKRRCLAKRAVTSLALNHKAKVVRIYQLFGASAGYFSWTSLVRLRQELRMTNKSFWAFRSLLDVLDAA
jgi:hypothetical protein